MPCFLKRGDHLFIGLKRRFGITLDHVKLADTGEAVPFSTEEMEALLTIEPTAWSTALAFWETVNGARAKN